MATLCFGGSFNPIHHGHLICARAAAEQAGYDRVLLIPAGQSPLKKIDGDMASPLHRLQMCRLAVENDPFFEVSSSEVEREELSYTLLTAQELKQQGWKKVAWLIGADSVAELPKWHRPMELMEEVEFVVMARPGWALDWHNLPEPFRKLQSNVVTVPQFDLSATLIRERTRLGQSIRYLVPQPVEAYIHAHRLYRPDEPTQPL